MKEKLVGHPAMPEGEEENKRRSRNRMYMTTRYFYPHGIEGEAMDCTYKYFDTIEKAIKYAYRYNKGMRFAGIQIEEITVDGKLGDIVYEITSDNETIDYRAEEGGR